MMRKLGLARNPTKVFLGEGSALVEHLQLVCNSFRIRFTIMEKKQDRVREKAKKLLKKMARVRVRASRDCLK